MEFAGEMLNEGTAPEKESVPHKEEDLIAFFDAQRRRQGMTEEQIIQFKKDREEVNKLLSGEERGPEKFDTSKCTCFIRPPCSYCETFTGEV